jgi:hypothetical protein
MDTKWLFGELDEEEEELTAVTCIIAAEYFSRMRVHPINYDRRLHGEFHQPHWRGHIEAVCIEYVRLIPPSCSQCAKHNEMYKEL